MLQPKKFLRNPNKGGSFRRVRDASRYNARWATYSRRYLVGHPVCHCDRVRVWSAGREEIVAMAPAGSVAPAEHVDHVRPIGMGGERFDPSNLQPLCRSCHSRKTVRFG
jgi:5-methylcytosine-specific restriction protein A